MPEQLWAPWRFKYVTAGKNNPCVFCHAFQSREDEKNYLLHRGKGNFIILNLFPYSNGHLMIAPCDHIESLEKASADQRHELIELTARCIDCLKQVYHPAGFNVGMNLGTVAGAGVADHYHLHIVPRWDGDTNFMTVLGEARVIPESLEETYGKLKRFFT
jgi:ATP adenylyltransferase